MLKRIIGCLLLIMATANIAEAIDGDLDLDGDVDFQDFLILVQNFGKQGPPSPARTDTIYVTKTDTVFITVSRHHLHRGWERLSFPMTATFTNTG